MSCRYRAVERFWTSFYRLSPTQKESVRKAWKIFKEDPFDPRLRTHKIQRLSARYGRTIYAVEIEGDLRATFLWMAKRSCPWLSERTTFTRVELAEIFTMPQLSSARAIRARRRRVRGFAPLHPASRSRSGGRACPRVPRRTPPTFAGNNRGSPPRRCRR